MEQAVCRSRLLGRSPLGISHAPGFEGFDYSALLVELALEIQKAHSSHRYCKRKSPVQTSGAEEEEADASVEHTGEGGSNEATNHPATAASFAKVRH